MVINERNFNSEENRFSFNGMEKDDEVKGNGNSLDFGARIYDSRLGRWLSVDPLAQKYPFATPYNFTLNNPILFIDPDGKEVTIHGVDANTTLTKLQSATSIILKIDPNGKLSATLPELPITLSKLDLALMTAINDKEVNVNLYTTKAEWYTSKDGSGKHPIVVGGYEGSEVIDGKVETTQIFNLDMANKLEEAGLDKAGNASAHEILESYYGGKDDPGGNYDTGYDSAHQKANNSDDHKTDNRNYKDKNTSSGISDVGLTDGKKRVKLTDNSPDSKTKVFKKEK